MAALAAKHGGGTTQPEPEGPDRDDTLTAAQAAENLRAGLGDHIVWEREFRHHTDHDGNPILVDPKTGEVYPTTVKDGAPTLPILHPSDGKPV